MRLSSGRFFAAAVLAAVLAAPPSVADEVDDTTRNAARGLAIEGRKAFDGGDYEKAVDFMRRAYALIAAPTLSVLEARALEKLGRLVEASEAYMRAVRAKVDEKSSKQFRAAVESARGEVAALRPRIPKVTVLLEGPGADHPDLVVKFDDKPIKSALVGVSMSVDPGKHRISAATPDGEGARAEVTLAEGKSERIVLTLVPGAAPVTRAAPTISTTDSSPTTVGDRGVKKGKTQRILAYTSLGVGAAGLGVGLATALMANNKLDSAKKACPERRCALGSQAEDDFNSFETLRTVSTASYIVGFVGVAAGVTLWLTAPSGEGPSVAAYAGVGSAGLRGAF